MEQTAEDQAALIRALEKELGLLLRRGRVLSAELARQVHADVDPGAYSMMVRLADTGPARPSELAAYFGIGKATTGRQLAFLEHLGLVSRQPDPQDGRAHLLALTEDGRARLDRVRSARQQRFRAQLAAWPTADIADFARLVGRFNDMMTENERG